MRREILPVGYLKGLYKSESSLMTCVAELHCSVILMPSSILSHIGNDDLLQNLAKENQEDRHNFADIEIKAKLSCQI